MEAARGDEPTGSRVEGAGWGGVRLARILHAVGVWVGLVVVAILNAGVRETFVTPAVGPYWGHVVGTATFVAGLSAVAYLYFGRLTDHSVRELLAIGGLWTAMTVAFEFGFGHYVMGHPWSRLLADYDLLAGRVWILVLLATLLSPLVFGHYLRR